MVIIPDTLNKDAANIGDRIRKNVKLNCGICVSIGIAHYKESAENLQNLLVNTDKALYAAKRNGRNRVAVFSCDF